MLKGHTPGGERDAMISIEAVIRPERIHHVTEAMKDAGCQGFYYANVTGEGRQQGVEVFVGRGGAVAQHHAVPKTLIRSIVHDDMREAVIEAIINAARTPGGGEIGDGKIFISPVADVVRVRTGDRGEDAV